MRVISRADAERALSMREAVGIIRRAFAEISIGTADVPHRAAIPQEKHGGTTLFMPGYLGEQDALACKIVSVRPRNLERGLPLINALVVLIDAATGEPLAALEGGYLTALRTGAASGAATELLARRDARVAAIFGAGAQSRTQLEAVCAVRQIERVWVYDREPEKARNFAFEMQGKMDGAARIEIAATPRQAVEEADVICAATTSRVPVFDGSDLRDGTHVNGVGSFTPEMREIDSVTLQRAAKIVVDSRQAAFAEAGDLIQALREKAIEESDIYAEIGEIVAGLKAGRETEREITYFKSVGNAAQDVAVAQAVYQLSLEQNFGVDVAL